MENKLWLGVRTGNKSLDFQTLKIYGALQKRWNESSVHIVCSHLNPCNNASCRSHLAHFTFPKAIWIPGETHMETQWNSSGSIAKGTNIMEFCGFAKQTKAYQLMYSGSFHPKPKIQIFTLVSIHLGFFIWEFLSLFGTPAICILLGFIRGRLLHEPSHPIGESVLLRSRWPWPGAMPRETHAVAFLWLSSLERLCASGCAKV